MDNSHSICNCSCALWMMGSSQHHKRVNLYTLTQRFSHRSKQYSHFSLRESPANITIHVLFNLAIRRGLGIGRECSKGRNRVALYTRAHDDQWTSVDNQLLTSSEKRIVAETVAPTEIEIVSVWQSGRSDLFENFKKYRIVRKFYWTM